MYFLLYSLKLLSLFEFIDDIFIISTHENESFIKSYQDSTISTPPHHISLELSTEQVHFLDVTVKLLNGHINTLYSKVIIAVHVYMLQAFTQNPSNLSSIARALHYNCIFSDPLDRDIK